ncbi:MAG: site-2 protease family protein, partial [Candidatus Burarchaeum sp.]
MAAGKTSRSAHSLQAKTAKKASEAPRRPVVKGKTEEPWCFHVATPLGAVRLSKATSVPLAALIALASTLLFFWLLDYPSNGVLKFIAAIGLLGMSGEAIRRLLNIEGEWGLMLLRTSNGLKKIDEISHWQPGVWRAFCEFGLVFGFGAASLLMFRNISKRVYIISLAILMLSAYVVLPFILPVALSVISNLPSGSFSAREAGSNADLLQYGVLLLLLLGGVTIAAILSLIANAAGILYVIASYLLGGGSEVLSSAVPGAAPLIPGKNIPLVEGILALAVILVVHECAHGILARLHKIKLKSAGLVFFGILPVGAFVDPDEKELEKSSAIAQRDVLVAGSTANFVTMFASFALLLLFLSASAAYFEDRHVLVTAYINSTELAPSAQILSFNGMQARSIDEVVPLLSNITANSTLELTSADGALTTVKIDANG